MVDKAITNFMPFEKDIPITAASKCDVEPRFVKYRILKPANLRLILHLKSVESLAQLQNDFRASEVKLTNDFK